MTFPYPVFVCRECLHAVTAKERIAIQGDPWCSRCNSYRWSEFVYIRAGANVREVIRQRGGSREEEIRQKEVLGQSWGNV